MNFIVIRNPTTYERFPLLVILVSLLFIGFVAPTRAADYSVFGIDLGQKITMPDCGAGAAIFDEKTMCVIRKGDMWRFTTSLQNLEKELGTEEISIYFPNNLAPPYLSGIDLGVEMIDGVVESIAFSTAGESVQNDVLAALTKKYGNPTSIRNIPLQNAFGAKIIAIQASWHKSGLFVEFNGAAGSVDHGRVEVSTERYRKRYEAWEKTDAAGRKPL